MWVYIWLGVILFAIVIELSTNEMVSVWFAGGGIFALIFSACGLDWYFSIPVFIVISIVAMLLFRKMVMEKINDKEVNLNADAAIGKEFKLITSISFGNAGSIKVNDVVWSAITKNPNDEISKGTIVTVLELKGNKYIVEVKK